MNWFLSKYLRRTLFFVAPRVQIIAFNNTMYTIRKVWLLSKVQFWQNFAFRNIQIFVQKLKDILEYFISKKYQNWISLSKFLCF